MKSLFAVALIAVATPALRADRAGPCPGARADCAAAPAAATKFNLDTPIETLIADPAAKAVLDRRFRRRRQRQPGLRPVQVDEPEPGQPYAPDKMPAALLTKVAADLAAIK